MENQACKDFENNYDSEKNFNTKSVVFNVQKKFLSQVSSSKSVQKSFLNDDVNRLLELLYELQEHFLCSTQHSCDVTTKENKKQREKDVECIKQRAAKVQKNLIKITVKISVLANHQQLNCEELVSLTNLRETFRKLVLTIVTYNQMPDCYNRAIILNQMSIIKEKATLVIARHLSHKSITRLDNVFDFFMNRDFVDAIFTRNSQQQHLMDQICELLHKQLKDDSI